jgi:8-oxo-dGTP pyrophosphatase MutT (NUDIX family)
LLFERKGARRFLLLRRGDRYDLPKGRMERGEDELATAFRELREETGIEPHEVERDVQFRFQASYPTTRGNGSMQLKTVVIFLGTVGSARPVVTPEHDGAAWIPWQPPHTIQPSVIDPLLAAVAAHWSPTPGL